MCNVAHASDLGSGKMIGNECLSAKGRAKQDLMIELMAWKALKTKAKVAA